MSRVFLCLEKECKAKSRYIEDTYVLFIEDEEHYSHKFVELTKLQAKMKKQQHGANSIETLLSKVSEMMSHLKKSNAQLVEQLANNLQKYILSKADAQTTELVRAILEDDLNYLQENQDYFPILSQPELISESQEKVFTELNAKFDNLFDLINEHCSKDLETQLQEQQNSKNQTIILQKEVKTLQEQLVQTQALLSTKETSIQVLSGQLALADEKYKDLEDKFNAQLQIIINMPYVNNGFTWSSINKHPSVQLLGKIAKTSGYDTAVLLDPRLDFQQTRSVRLKMVAVHYMFYIPMILICDLKTIKSKCSNFEQIFKLGFGAYSHSNDGYIYATETYGQKTIKSFTFAQGDILELQWNGPKKQFTTHKITTGEKFVFDVKFDINAEIYFGVSLWYNESVELI